LRCNFNSLKMPKATATQFQVKLSGEWKDYSNDEDRILKRAYLAGFPNARYSFRGHQYECNFAKMTQKNVTSGKVRELRPPHKWRAPAAPVCKPGPTMCIRVPEGAAGTTLHVPHPKAAGQFISVQVPSKAKVGQSMLVPIPRAEPLVDAPVPEAHSPAAALSPAEAVTPASSTPTKEKKAGWSTGTKVAAVGAAGGLAVAGVVLGEHIAEEGWDATLADLGDVATSVGEGIADGGEAAVDWVGDAAETVGDFVMDLF